MGKFRTYDPDQPYLMPPSPRDWLAEDHLSYFISDVVDQMGLQEIEAQYSDGRGQPAYHPSMLTKLLLYGYCMGIPSSRKIEQKTYEDVAFRVLSAGEHPDHDTISNFRKRHLTQLGDLFLKVLKLCGKAGLVKMGHVSLDGTKVRASASKHKAMSYGRMCEKEKELEQQIEEMLHRAQQVDEAEDLKYGRGKRGDELPEELRFRESRLRKIREAKEELEHEAREKAQEEGKMDEHGVSIMAKRGRKPKKPPGTPKDKVQKNFTDPESRIMLDGATKGFLQAYNAQAAVDDAHQVIVAADVTNESNDKKQLKPMVKEIRKNMKKGPKILSADAGYFSEENVKSMRRSKTDLYIPPDRQSHGKKEDVSCRGRPPKNLSVADRMRRKVKTQQGQKIYSRRKVIVEPVFGQIKEGRGFRRFLFRGLDSVREEWKIICMTHNILKLFRSGAFVPGAG